ncbi:short-chain fatty acid transporter [Lentibacillus cibarius]|uniref:Short-chain fatty acid transporter n=1 Tax=Lentibacillus cibarius TaxID=2583219 RepID=A0A549YEI3_9BACI|nr:short-chain fatty acid transporter [Lentibacillus cibarius]TMN21424.1 short-chain fatty acid transporter [Lentibacillus cibarius]TRM10300.1 short-chain fatty acid transporter [Lentibacillus cibarius]
MKGLTSFFDRMVQRYLPDAFLFAIILTVIVFFLGMGVTGSTPVEMVEYWGTGFWDLLAFAMQMSLIVVTGYILASTPVVRTMLQKISTLANTPGQAILLVTFVAAVACLINYGFGLVVGALLAIHVAKRIPSVDYRLLMASAYSGFLLWHGGFSGSIPLLIATDDHFLADKIGSLPVTETLFSSFNLFIVLFLLITMPLLNWYMMKTRDPLANATDATTWNTESYDHTEEAVATESITPAERLENSQMLSLLIAIMGLGFIVYHFSQNGFDLNINIVNFIFLFLGILFHRTPRRFLDSVSDAVKNVGGIIIQFPFYAGIMGMMVASGLSQSMSEWFVSISNDVTLPLFTFLSAGIVNFFVPSGGGQWAVQGPIMIPAALEIGADTAKTAMAVAWGDAWTNMIQPFWALPLLAIAGLKVRDIMGFCVIILFYSLIPISIGLLFM